MEPEDDYQNGDDQEGMRPMRKVGRINLIILLIYAGVLLIFTYLSADGELALWLIWVGIAMLAHGAINLAAGVVFFIMSKSELGKGALVSGLVLLVIGFSACVAVFSVVGIH